MYRSVLCGFVLYVDNVATRDNRNRTSNLSCTHRNQRPKGAQGTTSRKIEVEEEGKSKRPYLFFTHVIMHLCTAQNTQLF